MRNNLEYCPHCKVSLQGEKIPEDRQYHYGATHFSRKIGVYSFEKDKVEKWMCPDCEKTWNRI